MPQLDALDAPISLQCTREYYMCSSTHQTEKSNVPCISFVSTFDADLFPRCLPFFMSAINIIKIEAYCMPNS